MVTGQYAYYHYQQENFSDTVYVYIHCLMMSVLHHQPCHPRDGGVPTALCRLSGLGLTCKASLP